MAERMMGPSSNSSGGRIQAISIRTKGWTWLDRLAQLAMLALFPVAFLLDVVISGPRYPNDLVPRVTFIVVLLAGIDLLYVSIVPVRRVDVDDKGITFHYLFHKERATWADLSPISAPPQHGMWGLLRNRQTGGKLLPYRGHNITIEQARGILSFPACPRWELPFQTRQALGFISN
jgi:hypothetical protein